MRALTALCALALGLAAGCSQTQVEVAMLGGGADALLLASPAVLDELLDVEAELGPSLDDSAWPRCITANGSHALLAHPDAVRKGLAPSDRAHRVLVTDMPVAIQRADGTCARVFGASPGNGVVLVSARELRGRCSSMPVPELVARVAAHELGHVLELASGDDARCDQRGCHCSNPECLMADERGGCPQPGVTLCSRCAGK